MEYMTEEEAWKCSAHPSKRRPYGVCPKCLREKLSSLCPDCASLRPCSCCSSSDSSSSFSRFFSSRSSSTAPDRKAFNLIDPNPDPTFRRSRSVATLNLPSFLRSRSKFPGRHDATTPPQASAKPPASSSSSFWGKFRSKRNDRRGNAEDETRATMRKSRSVAVGYDTCLNFQESSKVRGWSRYLPSPMKAFGGGQGRSSSSSSSRSPLYRG